MKEFKITVAKSGSNMQFEDRAIAAEAVPRADARTVLGKRQNLFAECGVEALINLADDLTNAYGGFDAEWDWISGEVKGRLRDDGSGSITVTVHLT